MDADTISKNYCTRQTGFTTRLAFEAAAEAKMGRQCVIIVANTGMVQYISDLIRAVFAPHVKKRSSSGISLFDSHITFVTTHPRSYDRLRGRAIDRVLVDNSVSHIPYELLAIVVPMLSASRRLSHV